MPVRPGWGPGGGDTPRSLGDTPVRVEENQTDRRVKAFQEQWEPLRGPWWPLEAEDHTLGTRMVRKGQHRGRAASPGSLACFRTRVTHAAGESTSRPTFRSCLCFSC